MPAATSWPTSELPALIGSVFEALRTAGTVAVEQPVEALVPAVPIRKSVTPEFIVCLEDGKRLKMLKRHLATRLQPDARRVSQALGAAQGLPDGGTGLCGAALGAGQEHRARPQAGRRGPEPEPEPEPAARSPPAGWRSGGSCRRRPPDQRSRLRPAPEGPTGGGSSGAARGFRAKSYHHLS